MKINTPNSRAEFIDLLATLLTEDLFPGYYIHSKPGESKDDATIILDALERAGCAVVPLPPTEAMVVPLTRMWLLSDQEPMEADLREAAGYAKAVMAASPYRKDRSQK